MIFEQRFNTDSGFVPFDDGNTSVARVYHGNRLAEQSFYDSNIAPYPVHDYVREVYTYGANNIVTKEQLYRIDGSWTIRLIDSESDLVHETYFDAEGNPMSIDGAYGCDARYDEHGNQTVIRFRDINGEVWTNEDGVAIIQRSFNSDQLASIKYYDAAGKPVAVDNCFMITYSYDLQGRLIMEKCFGTNQQPVSCSAGYASVQYFYDGDQCTARYYDEYNRAISEEVIEKKAA